MNKFTKKQLIIGGLVLLVVINLAALGTFIYQNYKLRQTPPPLPQENIEERPGRPERQGSQRMQRKNDRFSYFIKERLDLSEEQFEKFKEIREESQQKQNNLRQELRKEMDTLMKELASDSPDQQKLDEVNQKIGKLHEELNNTLIQHFTKIKAICTTEQKEELNQLIRMMARHRNHPMHQHERRQMHKKNSFNHKNN